jgi:hypothetical protein
MKRWMRMAGELLPWGRLGLSRASEEQVIRSERFACLEEVGECGDGADRAVSMLGFIGLLAGNHIAEQ